jgi:hypothetical protein
MFLHQKPLRNWLAFIFQSAVTNQFSLQKPLRNWLAFVFQSAVTNQFSLKNHSETGSLSFSNRQSRISSVYKKQACTSNFCVTDTVYCIIHRIIQHHTQDSSFSRFKSVGVCCYDNLKIVRTCGRMLMWPQVQTILITK